MRLIFRILLIVATVSLSSVAARAEEESSGHYFPGALSSFIDMLPESTGSSTLAYLHDSTYYHGSSKSLFSNATAYTDSSVLLYQVPGLISILPGSPQYSVKLAVPYTWLKVHAPLMIGKRMFIPAKDTDNGFGDIEIFPFMMGWTKYECDEKQEVPLSVLKYQTAFGIYAPTGNFESNSVANIGRNYWTFEPSAAISFFRFPSREIPLALEFTTSAGFDFNTKNSATHYQTGDQFHLDGTLALHWLVSKTRDLGLLGAGVSGFFYQQITRDTGSGAFNGSFEAMTTGVGPALSYVYDIKSTVSKDHVTIGAEVKWLPELSVSNRLQGNIVWLKLAFSWGTDTARCPISPVVPPAGAPSLYAIPLAPAATPSASMRSLYALPSL
jgi:hypothetical protein